MDCFIEGCTAKDWGHCRMTDLQDVDILFKTRIPSGSNILQEVEKRGFVYMSDNETFYRSV